MKILGIESSADETGAAVIEDGTKLLSNVVASSLDLHQAYGGIVPEIAARSHIEVIIPVIDQAIKQANVEWEQIDRIAVTQGSGLLGSLLIGVITAKTLAIAKQKPLIPINHVQAHVYAAFLGPQKPNFPLLSLIVSGGHTQLVLFQNHQKYQILGQTTDDAAGEAYDKVAKMLGLPYPGGPSVSKCAENGDPQAYQLPTAKLPDKYDFSFSGLKTAVLRAAQTASGHDFTFPSAKLPAALSEAQKADLAASFQHTINQTLANSLARATEEFSPTSVVVAGGVAASQTLRRTISEHVPKTEVIYPEMNLCTDNAAMIAALAFHQKPLVDPHQIKVIPNLHM